MYLARLDKKFSNIRIWSNPIGENVHSYNFIEGNLKLAIEKYIFVYQIGMFQ